jgi:hypothetical protein
MSVSLSSLSRRPTSGLRLAAGLAAAAILVTTVGPVTAAPPQGNPSGVKTGQLAMLTKVRTDVAIEALLTVGETLPGGYRFESIPDGISLRTRGNGRVDLYVNHETSTVPFPYTPAAPTEVNSQNDFDNSQLSHVILNQHSGGVLSARMAIRSEENWQRFCSNFLATAEQGFDREILFTNEEATDTVNRTGIAWPLTVGGSDPQQAGVVVAYDVRTGKHRPILGMGRHNHENAVAIPGFNELMVLSGDDTFTSNPAGSQVYAYFADSASKVWNDEGSLWGFRADDFATYNDYYDFPVGSSLSVPGEFVEIRRADAVGDQNALEAASDARSVFQFVRIEDIAYDRNNPNVVYLADSGRGLRPTDSLGTPAPAFRSTNGRIWKMVLDPANPRNVLSLSILIEGDDNPVKTLGEIHQPDNLETTANSLLIQEDPGSSQQFNPGDTDATTARIWRYDVSGTDAGTLEVVAKVDQSADEGSTDVDSASAAKWGAWESSGIVDASAAFGPGAFLVTVQAHSLWIEKAPGPDYTGPYAVPDGVADFTLKREGGQLLLVRIPGA